MDFGQGNNHAGPSGLPPSQPIPPSAPAAKPAKKRTGWKIFWGVFTVLSVLANIALFLVLIGAVALFATGQKGIFTEQVIQKGPPESKIAVINLKNIIDDEIAQQMYEQLKLAAEDKKVKGLIIRIDSPGGRVSSSDQIHNEILKYRKETGKPVVAFMQGLAASGGYYTSVACETIVAEPTTITGSIGVIMGHFVLQELLEGKLGIQPVIVKSGPKKDWPSPFHPPTEEQLKYLEDKLISPAYERFVQIVADGRTELTLDEVRRLSDGSIYGAQEALDEKLIDRIGYLDEAIEEAMSLAGLEEAKVIEYHRPFSMADFLNSMSQNTLKINRTMLHELSTPQALYLWSAN